MTILEIIQEIGSRLDDPDLYTYADNDTDYNGRAKRGFANAVYSLIEEKQYSLNDIFGMIEEVIVDSADVAQDTTSLYYYYDLVTPDTSNNILDILLRHPDLDLRELTISEFRDIDLQFENYSANLLKFCKIGNRINFMTTEKEKTDNTQIMYIKDIADFYTIDETTNMETYFSKTFINKAISLAVRQLMLERNNLVQ